MKLTPKEEQTGMIDTLIHGKEYTVYRDGNKIGIAKYLNKGNFTHGFYTKDSYGNLTVCVVDEWVFA